jgi:hypothetical protein
VIEPRKTRFIFLCFFLLAAASAFAQRGFFGAQVGETSDKFGTLSYSTVGLAGVEGEVIVIQGSQKAQSPDIVAGGELRFPTDSTNHAEELAAYGGLMFHFGGHFSAGFHAQIRKFLMPTSPLPTQTFNRYNMLVLEAPAVLEYRFGPGNHAFVQAQVQPEFTPKFSKPKAGTPFPHPTLDHAYTIRGSVGYDFGKYYLKGTYETRYFKFVPGVPNPNYLANWRTNAATAGFGFVF